MKTRTLLLLAVALTFGSAAFAQEAAPQVNDQRIDQREQNQQKRIAAGEVSGSLTPAEAAKLEKKEAKFDKKEDKAEADGKLTPKERMRLNRDQNRLSRDIYREKHDAQTDREGKGLIERREQNQQRAHLRLADYIEHQPVSPRRTDELPWQLAEADEKTRLAACLSRHPSVPGSQPPLRDVANERRQLNREQNRESRAIYRKKHNARTDH